MEIKLLYNGVKYSFGYNVFLLAYWINGDINLSIRNYGLSVVLCMTGGLLFSFLLLEFSKFFSSLLSRLAMPPQSLGQYSLVIFAIQMPCFNIEANFISHFLTGNGALQGFFVVFTQLLFSILGGYLIARLVHKLCPTLF